MTMLSADVVRVELHSELDSACGAVIFVYFLIYFFSFLTVLIYFTDTWSRLTGYCRLILM